MAGYLFSLDNENSLIEAINKGIFSVRLSAPSNNSWSKHHEGTMADYSSMKAGDNIYFFIKRKIYGIGTLVNVGDDCKYLNYPGSNFPVTANYSEISDFIILNDESTDSLNLRFICVFEPSPYFFVNGIDIDELLSSAPNEINIVRTFWKLSFIKFSDIENQAFKNIILRRNLDALDTPTGDLIFNTSYAAEHSRILELTNDNDTYNLSISPFLSTIANNDLSVKHEMAIEAAIIYQLSKSLESTTEVFGSWDYLTHQVIASPLKPIDYIDKMDVFGYRYIPGQYPTISDYLVIEIKKGKIELQDFLQLMKYVDWVKNEYSYGDYNMITAFLVGSSFSEEVVSQFEELIERKFIYGVRPSIPATWKKVKLVKYIFNPETELLDFEIIN